MNSYVKIFSSILTSTVWQEPLPTKVVWITMLVLSDAEGVVVASVPGLASQAGVTVAECEAALEALSRPDPYSRTKDHEGRRIKRIEDGWLILNRIKYREKTCDRTDYWRNYKRKRRQKMSTVDTAGSPHFSTQEEKKEDKKDSLTDFENFWAEYPRKEAKAKAEKAWKDLNPSQDHVRTIMMSLSAQKTCSQWQQENGRFIPHAAKWLEDRRWEDQTPNSKEAAGTDAYCCDICGKPTRSFIEGKGRFCSSECRQKAGIQ